MTDCSMFQIEMGSTNVRIGSTIFGAREYKNKPAWSEIWGGILGTQYIFMGEIWSAPNAFLRNIFWRIRWISSVCILLRVDSFYTRNILARCCVSPSNTLSGVILTMWFIFRRQVYYGDCWPLFLIEEEFINSRLLWFFYLLT